MSLLFAAACGESSAELALPPLDGAKTLVLAYEGSDLSVEVIDLTVTPDPVRRKTVESGTPVHALLYAKTPKQLHLPPGDALADAAASPLPAPTVGGFLARVDSGRKIAWAESAEPTGALASFHPASATSTSCPIRFDLAGDVQYLDLRSDIVFASSIFRLQETVLVTRAGEIVEIGPQTTSQTRMVGFEGTITAASYGQTILYIGTSDGRIGEFNLNDNSLTFDAETSTTVPDRGAIVGLGVPSDTQRPLGAITASGTFAVYNYGHWITAEERLPQASSELDCAPVLAASDAIAARSSSGRLIHYSPDPDRMVAQETGAAGICSMLNRSFGLRLGTIDGHILQQTSSGWADAGVTGVNGVIYDLNAVQDGFVFGAQGGWLGVWLPSHGFCDPVQLVDWDIRAIAVPSGDRSSLILLGPRSEQGIPFARVTRTTL